MAFFGRWRKAKKIKDSDEASESTLDNESDTISDNTSDGTDENFDEEEDAGSKDLSDEELAQEKSVPVSYLDKKRFVNECCETVAELDRQISDARREYEKVTSFLTDIQKIDRIAGDDRKELTEICKNIINLTNERNNYKNRTLTISDAEVRRLEPYEENLVDEVKKMYEAEAYQRAIESDINNLGKEKKMLYGERKGIVEKQNALKAMAKVLTVLIISLMVLLAVIYYTFNVDMTFPYLGVILLAAISATVLFLESGKNRKDMIITERKINKAINLLNKVKIKYVNNINVLDYSCEKYGVKNALDFEKKWNEYCKMKEYERRFRENTDKLSFNNSCLMEILKKYNVEDRDIWVSHAIAINDNKEMVEIRHELNGRRQKLRERIEYNESIRSQKVEEINKLIEENPDMKKEILDIVKKNIKNN